jgi:hypothetical protein
MALKADCERIGDNSQRILHLIRLRQLAKLAIEENPDAEIDVTPGMKQAWNSKIDALQAEIRAVVAGW